MRHLPFTSVVASLALLFLTGCLPESKNPLSSPATSRIDERFEGVYAQQEKGGEEDPGYWHFHYRGVPVPPHAKARPTPWLEIMGVEHLKQGGLKTTRYEALATRINGRDYLSFYELPESGAKKTGKGARLPYRFARYEFNWLGELHVWLASNAEFAAAVRAGKIRGRETNDKFGQDVKLTDTSANLAAFIAAGNAKELFGGKPMVMRRIRR